MAPGQNNRPEPWTAISTAACLADGGLSAFSTSDNPIGTTKTGVFDYTQIIVVAKGGDGQALVLRDWGGNRVYDWPGFDPRAEHQGADRRSDRAAAPSVPEALKKRIDARMPASRT